MRVDNDLFKGKYVIPSSRIPAYDYASHGMYFVTICTQNRICCLGEVHEEKVELSVFGKIVRDCILDLPNHYWNCDIDMFVIMPNHLHLIIGLDNSQVSAETGLQPVSLQKKDKLRVPYALSEIIRGLKTFSAKNINGIRGVRKPFWQARFYEHVIRNEHALDRIRGYIVCNPEKWNIDTDNPAYKKYQKQR